ncbi:MAG: hypothetical protein R3E96_15820 [Planctomycetota bacterium]
MRRPSPQRVGPWAPWYAIPADNKDYMRCAVIDVVNRTLEGMGLAFPELDPEEAARLQEMRARLVAEKS